MIVDEGFLHAEEMVESAGPLARLDEQDPPLRHVDIIDVERQSQPIFDMRRHEGGGALD
jgi:hypothetical protein